MEPLLGQAAASAASHVSKDASGLLARALGPAADEIGTALGRFTARQVGNVERVAEASQSKGSRKPPGVFDTRAALRIMEDSASADNEVVAEYLSGVLASARDAEDDGAVSWSALIARMSTAQLRLHYVLYAAVRHLWQETGTAPAAHEICTKMVYVSFDYIAEGMDWPAPAQFSQTFPEVFYGLDRENLLDTGWHFGSSTDLQERSGRAAPNYGVIFPPSRPGLGLWLWAMGHGGRPVFEAVAPDAEADPALMTIQLGLDSVAFADDLPAAPPA